VETDSSRILHDAGKGGWEIGLWMGGVKKIDIQAFRMLLGHDDLALPTS
jgi:hypothetical protein